MLDIISPANFVATNPEVLQLSAETRGVNFLHYFKNYIEDVNRLQTHSVPAGLDAFEVGNEVTATPDEVVGLVGPSGSGKSTLLKCLGAIIEPSSGEMTLGDELIYDNGWTIPDLRALRRDRIGVVFQAPYLIPFLDVKDNAALLPMLAGFSNTQARTHVLELLTSLDVVHRAKVEPSQLSGGEQQRVSVARVLANRPPGILADESTAPFDSKRALGVMRILNAMTKQSNTAINVVTHDEKIIPTFKCIYYICDGLTQGEVVEGRSIDESAVQVEVEAA